MRTLASLLLITLSANAGWVERYHLGEDLLQQGRPDEAIRELRSALADQPDNMAILDALGRAELGAGRYRSARSYFERETRLGKGDPIPHTNLALTCIALGEHRRAEHILKQVLVTDPENHVARRALAQALVQQGHHAQAASILEKLLIEGRDKTALADLSVIYEALRQPAKALELVLQAIAELEPGQSRARLLTNLGVLHWKMGARKESESSLQKALAEMEASVGNHHPDTAWILEQYSHVLRSLGRKEEARTLDARAWQIRSTFSAEVNERRLTVDWRDTARRRN